MSVLSDNSVYQYQTIGIWNYQCQFLSLAFISSNVGSHGTVVKVDYTGQSDLPQNTVSN